MFGVEPEAPPQEPEALPRPGLAELLRRMPAAQILTTGASLLGAAIILQIWTATESLACRREGATTSCTASRHVVFGLVPAGTSTIADVRGARIVRLQGKGPGNYHYYVTLETAAGEYEMRGTSSFEAASEAVAAVNEAIRTKADRFDVSIASTLSDALARLLTVVLTLAGAALTGLGLVRLTVRR